MGRPFCFSNAPYTLHDIPLGSLISDLRYPNQDSLSVRDAKPDVDFGSRYQDDFSGTLASSASSSLGAQLTRLVTFGRQKSNTDNLKIKAIKGTLYELKEPKVFFKLVCAEPKARTWLQEGLEQGLVSHFVTGFRTFHDAVIGEATSEGSKIELKGTAPVGEAIAANTGVDIGDTADMAVAWQKTKGTSSEETFTTTGEYIYAICYRKIILRSKSISDARLDRTNQWKLFSDSRSGQSAISEAEVLEADLEDDDIPGDIVL